ncbi:MAG: M15 family metallopeptidase [Spirochaetes bacterium]|nr:M15 family metallopeptidase [Spirochaetota bacterium]
MRSRRMAYQCALVMGVFIAAGSADCGAEIVSGQYGGIVPEKYLTGRFDPEKEEGFVDLSTLGIPVKHDRQFLRREAAEALAAMFRDFRKAHPYLEFRIRSSTRNWGRQKTIWESKWCGTTPVGGVRLNEVIKDPEARALKILEFSSMPGTSRHHWGTDFDFQELDNRYYESGPGKALYRWLVSNAQSYGFCQPYTSARTGGYLEEKWHWSYMPLAGGFLAEWIRIFKKCPACIAENDSFAGSDAALPLASLYMENINPACR